MVRFDLFDSVMPEIKYIELSDLFDLLAMETSHYMKMLSDGATQKEFDDCRERIIDIQSEIEWRKMRNNGEQSNPGTSPLFTKPNFPLR
jgi:hypothetical protein